MKKVKKVEDVEEKEIVDEISLRENDNEETDFEDLMDAVDDYFEPNTPEHKKLMDAVENALNNGEIDTMDFSHSPAAPSKAVRMIAKEMGMDERLNESFLYMQKLAGVITEGQYQAKIKLALFENESSEDIVSFLNSNFKEVVSKLGNPGSKFKNIGDIKVATAGKGESGIDISFDEQHMLNLFPKNDPYNKVKSINIAGKIIYYNDYR